MRHEYSKKIFNYWDNLRGNRPAPGRAEIEPSDIRDLLGDTFILEIDQRMRTISFRLAGTRICTAYGRELKGLGYMALWDEADNLKVIQNVTKVYQDNIPIVIGHISIASGDRSVECETVLLPLAQNLDNNVRILGICTPKTTPYWMGADPITNNMIKTVRPIMGSDVEPPSFRDGFAPSIVPSVVDLKSTPAEHAGEGSRKVAHLTVLDGGRQDD